MTGALLSHAPTCTTGTDYSLLITARVNISRCVRFAKQQPFEIIPKKPGITERGNNAHFFLFFSSYTNRILLHSYHSTPLCIHNNCIHKDTEIDIERSTEQQCCQSPGIFVTFVWLQYLMRRATDSSCVWLPSLQSAMSGLCHSFPKWLNWSLPFFFSFICLCNG